jgi:hypothetical protein
MDLCLENTVANGNSQCDVIKRISNRMKNVPNKKKKKKKSSQRLCRLIEAQ